MIRTLASTRPLHSVVVVAAMAVVLVLGFTRGAAFADGGDRPSNAPTLRSGQAVSGGADSPTVSCSEHYQCIGSPGVQYWRVSLALGDHLTINFHTINHNNPTGICVMSGSVTDYTDSDATCLTEEYTSSDGYGQLTYDAARTATYLIVPFAAYDWDNDSWAYTMTPYVAHPAPPSLTFSGPKRAKVGTTIHLGGTISPHITKRLTLQSESPDHGWETAGHAKPNGDGVFSFTYRPGHTGKHVFKVIFPGKNFYLPASKEWKVQVHR